MPLTWNEKAALFLSLAPAPLVWRQLDTLSPARFQAILTAKRELTEISQSELLEARHISPLDMMQGEFGRDSRRALLPGQLVEAKHLDWLPHSVRLSYLLGQLHPQLRELILKTMHSELAELLRGRIGQGWKFSSAARLQLAGRTRFDRELFERFARCAPTGVAEWLLDRLFFGVAAVSSLCEISPLFGRQAVRGGGLRRRVQGGNGSNGLNRHQQLAIVLMSLPPEVSAQLFKHLGPETVHAITLQISKLPPITPEVRMEAIAEVTNLSPQELETNARAECENLSECLKRYLEEG